MISSNKVTPLLWGVNVLYACCASLSSNSLATFLLVAFLLLIGTFLIKSGFDGDSYSLNIFLLFFSLYGIYMLVANLLYVENPLVDFFYAYDSTTFYEYVDFIARKSSIEEIISYCFNDYFSRDWRGFAMLSGILGFIANKIDYNNLIFQKMVVVFLSSFLLVFLYQMLVKKYEKRSALRMTIAYGLLSYSFFYSAVYIRDVHIGFLFMLMIYMVSESHRLINALYILLICYAIFLFRPEHGYYSLVFLAAYLYLYIIKTSSSFLVKSGKMAIASVLIIVLFFGFNIQEGLDVISTTSNVYFDNSLGKANLGSLGAQLLQLPWGIRHVAIGTFSQTMPFPFYVVLEDNLMFIPWAIAALFWFVVWFIIIAGISSRKIRRYMFNNLELNILFIIAIVLILGTTSNADTRRIMVVYPVIYMIFLKSYIMLGNSKVKIVGMSLVFYMGLLLLYNVMKL